MKLKKEEKIYLLVQFIILLGIPLVFTLFVERVYSTTLFERFVENISGIKGMIMLLIVTPFCENVNYNIFIVIYIFSFILFYGYIFYISSKKKFKYKVLFIIINLSFVIWIISFMIFYEISIIEKSNL